MKTLSCLSDLSHVQHAFLTRRGGCSTGVFESLNASASSGDSIENVLKNHRIALKRIGIGGATLMMLQQMHGTKTISVTEAWDYKARPKADAMVTNVPGLALGISGADCPPILLADRFLPVIGAAHSGWKGAKTGVLESVVKAMNELGAKDIVAGIGPSIEQKSYEVGAAFREEFMLESAANKSFFRPQKDRFLFDIKEFVKNRLKQAGVTIVQVSEQDTYTEEDLFFSYRRACHQGHKKYGCNLSVVALKSASMEV